VSQENVETIRRWYEAAARHDVDALVATFDQDIEWDLTRMGWIEGQGIYRGKSDVRRFIEQWFGSFDGHEFLLDEFEYFAFEDGVLVTGRQRGYGAGTGAPVEQKFAHLFSLRDGAIQRSQLFPTKEQAEAAAELGGSSRDG
jgi:ketosteroid isomerase-like protein